MRTKLGKIRLTALLLTGMGLNLYLLGFWLGRDSLALMGQLQHLSHWFTLLAWILCPLYLWFLPRPWKSLTLMLVPPMLMFIIWHGAAFLPKPTPSHADNDTVLTVATYNLKGNTHGGQPALLPVLSAMDADIVGLQEIAYTDLLTIKRELAEAYPYQEFYLNHRFFDLIGLLSRYPIIEVTAEPRDFTRVNWNSPRFFRAVIDKNGQEFAVYVFHPMRPLFKLFTFYDDRPNRQNVEQLLTALETETLPTLVLCDCNTTPLTPQYAWLAARLDDLQAERGWGLGLTHTGLPWVPFQNTRLDYIWYSEGFHPLQVQVWGEKGDSDHNPVWGQFSFQP